MQQYKQREYTHNSVYILFIIFIWICFKYDDAVNAYNPLDSLHLSYASYIMHITFKIIIRTGIVRVCMRSCKNVVHLYKECSTIEREFLNKLKQKFEILLRRKCRSYTRNVIRRAQYNSYERTCKRSQEALQKSCLRSCLQRQPRCWRVHVAVN